MVVTLLDEFVLLFQMACVVFLFAYLFSKSRFFAQVQEHRVTIATQVLLAIIFGLLSVYGMSSGISFHTATVNIRDFGPMAAGLACGPYIGIGAGIIGFAFRLAAGGTNVYAVALAPLVAGIIGGLVWHYSNRSLPPTGTAVFMTFLAESFVSAIALVARILAGEPVETVLTVTVNVAIPMIFMTTLAVGVFCIILHNQVRERAVEAEKHRLELEVESRRNLNAIIDTIAVPVYVLDRAHRFVFVNDRFCRFIGKERDEILTKTHRDLYSPADAERHGEWAEKVFLGHEPREEEVTVTKPDGTVCTLISTSAISVDAAGGEFLVGAIQDITDRKRMQTALLESEKWYRILFEHTGTATIIINDDGTIDQANSEFLELTGLSRDEIRGNVSWKIIAHPDDLAMVKEYHRARRSDPASVPSSYTVRMTDRHGIVRTLHAVVALIPGTKKSIASYIDISDQKKTQEALTLVNRKLNLLSSITRHDIINQILILKGFLVLLKKKTEDPALLDYIGRSEKATASIEHQILFTRDYQDMGVKAPAWQNVKNAIIRAKGALATGTVRIETDHAGLEIFADPLFEKVFYNLIDNSLRYGGPNLSGIRIGAEETPDGLTITYEDDGAGISPADRAHIFERGFGKNTGFGLFLSREILSITGITIRVEPPAERGARFVITIPRDMYRFRDLAEA